MKENILKFLFFVAVLAVIVSLIMAILATLGAVKSTEGCFYRYNLSNDNKTIIQADKITASTSLNADGNYNSIESKDANGKLVLIPDPNRYGEWVNTNLRVHPSQEIGFKIRGEVSLCRAYLPVNNIQSLTNLYTKDNNGHKTGEKIAIPRIEEANIEPLSLYFDAKIDQWRNIAELENNDHVIISVLPEKRLIQDGSGGVTREFTNIPFINVFTGENIGPIDCTEGKTTYHPVCGRYSIYSGQYVSSCEYKEYGCMCMVKTCVQDGWIGGSGVDDHWCTDAVVSLFHHWEWLPRSCPCWANIYSDAPEAYRNNGFFTHPGFGSIDDANKNISKLLTNFQPSCCSPENKSPYPKSYTIGEKDYINGDYQNKKYFWFSADNIDGLLFRFNSTNSISSTRGTKSSENGILGFSPGYRFAAMLEDEQQKQYNSIPNDHRYHIIYNNVYTDNSKKYLQYRFHADDGKFANNTGGYVLNIKQTKCRRSNGNFSNDTGETDRGRIEYLVVMPGENPNTSTSSYPSGYLQPKDGDGQFTVPDSDNAKGYLWMRVNNNRNDYKESFGKYIVQFATSEAIDSFNIKILNVIIQYFKDMVKTATIQTFKNMVCYERDPNIDYKVTSCTNFFSYIKAMLALYIMSYGAMFLLGMVQISQLDLVTRVIKIALVAGLMNQNTFNFFNSYVFDFVTEFSDTIISNMAGYSMFSNDQKITNPFMFMDSLLTKIFLTKTFMSQILALIGMGLAGILYFIIIFIALAIMLVTLFRAMTIYIMAFLAIAVLMGLAPLFLTFMLFDYTRYLFDNWVRFTFRYMIEPTILMAGIIILTQLFTLYLDYAVGYSVCWKCVLPIKFPFPKVPGFNPAFANVELFCINWFAPWGFDHRSGMMGINMQHVVALVIIAYCLYGYAELSSKMVVKLTNTGGPSATSMGGAMSSRLEDAGLKKIGLDKQSRNNIAQGIKARLNNRKGNIKDGNKVARKAANKVGDQKQPTKSQEVEQNEKDNDNDNDTE